MSVTPLYQKQERSELGRVLTSIGRLYFDPHDLMAFAGNWLGFQFSVDFITIDYT